MGSELIWHAVHNIWRYPWWSSEDASMDSDRDLMLTVRGVPRDDERWALGWLRGWRQRDLVVGIVPRLVVHVGLDDRISGYSGPDNRLRRIRPAACGEQDDSIDQQVLPECDGSVVAGAVVRIDLGKTVASSVIDIARGGRSIDVLRDHRGSKSGDPVFNDKQHNILLTS